MKDKNTSMTEPIEFGNARIIKVDHTIKNGIVRSVLHFEAAMSHPVAKSLGIYPLVYSPDGIPKFGFKDMGLELKLDDCFRLYMAVAGLEAHALDLQGDGADSFKIIRAKERMGVKFKINTLSNPHEILEWQINHGEGFGFCSLSPLLTQDKLPDTTAAPPLDRKSAAAGDTVEEEPIPAEPPVEAAPAPAEEAGTTSPPAAAKPNGAARGRKKPADLPPAPHRENIDDMLRGLEQDFQANPPQPPQPPPEAETPPS